jgi:hypothetical protein
MQIAIAADDLELMAAELPENGDRDTGGWRPAVAPPPGVANMDTSTAAISAAARLHAIAPDWTDAELNTAIVALCDEMPPARMAACSRALEHCRRHTPRGTPAFLLSEMRRVLRLDMESNPPFAGGRLSNR